MRASGRTSQKKARSFRDGCGPAPARGCAGAGGFIGPRLPPAETAIAVRLLWAPCDAAQVASEAAVSSTIQQKLRGFPGSCRRASIRLHTACSSAQRLLPPPGRSGAVPDAAHQEVSHYKCYYLHLGAPSTNSMSAHQPSIEEGRLAWWRGRWSRRPPRPWWRGDGRRRLGCCLERCSCRDWRRQRLRLGSGDDLLDAGAQVVHRGLHVGVQHAADVRQHIQQPCRPAAPCAELRHMRSQPCTALCTALYASLIPVQSYRSSSASSFLISQIVRERGCT